MKRKQYLPNNIRAIRKAKGIKAADCRIIFGICERQMTDYETGKVVPQVTTALRIAQALGCSVSDLYDIKDIEINREEDDKTTA